MTHDKLILSIIFSVLSLVNAIRAVTGKHFFFDAYLYRTWLFFSCFIVIEFISFSIGIWILALICFTSLREYLSMIDIRLQDRLGILGAYLSIPFMIYYIQSGWYNMFIITVPVYSFLAIPLLVTLGGKETQGTVFSIGAIDLGLFLFVYCFGHIGYLARYTIWMAVMLIILVALCDATSCLVKYRIFNKQTKLIARYFIPLPLTVTLSLLMTPLTGIPLIHGAIIGSLVPLLGIMGHHTIDYIKADLGIEDEFLLPGRGQILDNMKSIFYAAPIVFHYYKYFCA